MFQCFSLLFLCFSFLFFTSSLVFCIFPLISSLFPCCPLLFRWFFSSIPLVSWFFHWFSLLFHWFSSIVQWFCWSHARHDWNYKENDKKWQENDRTMSKPNVCGKYHFPVILSCFCHFPVSFHWFPSCFHDCTVRVVMFQCFSLLFLCFSFVFFTFSLVFLHFSIDFFPFSCCPWQFRWFFSSIPLVSRFFHWFSLLFHCFSLVVQWFCWSHARNDWKYNIYIYIHTHKTVHPYIYIYLVSHRHPKGRLRLDHARRVRAIDCNLFIYSCRETCALQAAILEIWNPGSKQQDLPVL